MLTTTDRRKLRAAVARGAKRLDKMVRGWQRRVRLTELAMREGHYEPGTCGCVLAQLSEDGKYESGLRMVDAYDDEQRFGFDVGEGAVDEQYTLLDEAWKDEIRARRRPGFTPA